MKLLSVLIILGLVTGCYYPVTSIEAEEFNEGNDMSLTNKDGWSSSGTLISNNPQKRISLQVDFSENAGGPGAGNYLIQFGIQLPPRDPVSPISVTPIAEITWSVEGNSVTRVVSVTPGLSVSGAGQAVKVVIYDNGTGVALVEYAASIQVVPGVRPSQNQPPTLIGPQGNLADASAVIILVPQNVGIISVMITIVGGLQTAITPIPPGSVKVSQKNSALVTKKNYEPQNYDFMPAVPDLYRIDIRNDAGLVNGINYSITYGIDG